MRPASYTAPSSDSKPRIATGFDFKPLPTGDVLIEFFADGGKTINTQVITRKCLARLPIRDSENGWALASGAGR